MRTTGLYPLSWMESSISMTVCLQVRCLLGLRSSWLDCTATWSVVLMIVGSQSITFLSRFNKAPLIVGCLHAALGDKLDKVTFDQDKLRDHLSSCFSNSCLTGFPQRKNYSDLHPPLLLLSLARNI